MVLSMLKHGGGSIVLRGGFSSGVDGNPGVGCLSSRMKQDTHRSATLADTCPEQTCICIGMNTNAQHILFL